jgi:hypothetical protein
LRDGPPAARPATGRAAAACYRRPVVENP